MNKYAELQKLSGNLDGNYFHQQPKQTERKRTATVKFGDYVNNEEIDFQEVDFQNVPKKRKYRKKKPSTPKDQASSQLATNDKLCLPLAPSKLQNEPTQRVVRISRHSVCPPDQQ